MDGKKSFLLYCDQIGLFEQLPDEQAGKLIKLIFAYVNDQDPKVDDLLLKIAFEPIKLQLKRDLKNWEGIKEDRSNSGQLGNLKRWHPDIHKKVIADKLTLEEGLKLSQKIAKDRTATKSIANVAVNDTVTGTVNVKDNVTVTNTNSLDARKAKFVLECSKENNEKNIIPSIELIAPPGDYRETFISYWTRTTPKGKKMEFEKKPTFDIPRRLTTWARNLEKYSNSKQNNGDRRSDFQRVHDEIPGGQAN